MLLRTQPNGRLGEWVLMAKPKPTFCYGREAAREDAASHPQRPLNAAVRGPLGDRRE